MSVSQTQPRPTKRLIKEAVKKLLLGKTEARNNVSIFATVPNSIDQLPKINIYLMEEEAERFNQAPKDYKRTPQLIIELILDGDNDDELDLRMEIMGEQVETLMELDETLGGIVDKLELSGSKYQLSNEGSIYAGSLLLSFNVVFYNYAIRPNSICYPPLNDAEVNWEIGPEKETTAEDLYEFEQGETP